MGALLDFTAFTATGAKAAWRLLEERFPGVRGEVEKHRAFRSDVMDAFALLGTARRLRDGIARALPARPSTTPVASPCRSGRDFLVLRLSAAFFLLRSGCACGAGHGRKEGICYCFFSRP